MSGSGIKGGGRFSGIGPGHFMLAHYRKPGAAGTSLEYKTVLLFSLFLPGCGPGSNITAHNAQKIIAHLYSDYNEPLDIQDLLNLVVT